MGSRDIHLLPVKLLILLAFSGNFSAAQDSLLEREVTLSHVTGEVDGMLEEISRKLRFSFTYTSEIDVHRLAAVEKKRQTVREHLGDIFRYDSIQFVERNRKILLVPLRTAKNLDPPKVTVLHGLVIDARTRRPLPYASVFLVNKSTGMITNQAGRFDLKLSTTEPDDTLAISYIGYKPYKIAVHSADSSLILARLNAERYQIREVIVKPLDPIYIITKAIEKIPENYDRSASLMTAFFREASLQDENSISLSEAVIHIYKEPYVSAREDQVKIFKGRKSASVKEKAFVEFIVQGGLYYTLLLDIVKYKPTFLDAEYFALYEYAIEKIFSHFGRPTYVISFDQREGVKYPCYRGKMYIDVESLAIVAASFELSDNSMRYAPDLFIKKSSRRVGVKPLSAVYQVYYRYYGGKWNLSNVRSEISIRVRKKKDKQQVKFNSDFSSISEFVVTHKDTAHVSRFKIDEVFRPRDILADQIGETDREFWGSENIISASEPIDKTWNRLWRRNFAFSDEEIAAIKIEEEKEDKLNEALQELHQESGKSDDEKKHQD